MQNHEAYAFAQALVDDHGANIVSAGGLYGDRRTFVTLQLPDPIRIGDDPHIPYLVLTNSHDGSTALTTAVTPVRVVCQNTARAALSRARHKWFARHTAGVTNRIAEARRTLNLAHAYTAAFRTLGEDLLAQRFTPAQFDTMTNFLLATQPDSTQRQAKTLADARAALHGLFTTAPTQDSIRGTRWAAYNAVTEYADWGPLRGADPTPTPLHEDPHRTANPPQAAHHRLPPRRLTPNPPGPVSPTHPGKRRGPDAVLAASPPGGGDATGRPVASGPLAHRDTRLGSRIGTGATEPLLRPRDIYAALASRPWPYLRQKQGEVLENWYARKDDRDVVIKQNTGDGKTVAGLLIAQSCLNEGVGKAVHLAPDTYVAGRAREEAGRLGLAVTDDLDDPDFWSQKAILVTTFQKLVNGRSRFGLSTTAVSPSSWA